MKKILLCAALALSITSGYTFVSAQSVINYRSDTGAIQTTDAKGRGFIYDPSTGAYKVSGSIGGVGISIGSAGISSQSSVGGGSLLGLLALAQKLVARLVPFLIGVAVIVFFWFLIQFIWKGNESGDVQKKALSGMAYSVLALFVMVTIWGIIGFMASVVGINVGGSIPNTCLPGERSC